MDNHRQEAPGAAFLQARVAGAAGREVGELHCRHRYGFRGDGDPSGRRWHEGEPRLDAEGRFRTGDLARMPASGNLEFLGRCDLSVSRDGLLVPFDDVEAALAGLDGVEQAGIASHAAGRRGQRIVAFCVLAAGSADTAEEVRRLSKAARSCLAQRGEPVLPQQGPRTR